jgi:nicotinamide-nucleotide amidase
MKFLTFHRPLRVGVVCVGTELLTGKVNTHTAYLGRTLETIGLSLAWEQTVGDDRHDMRNVFKSALSSAEIVICCGGLGPTFDDITRDVWSQVLKKPLRRQLRLVLEIQEKFKQRGLVMPKINERQGLVLSGAEVLPNTKGTAPGQILFIGRKTLVLLPGPTRELITMVESELLPRLQARYPLGVRMKKSFHMVGVPESYIDELIRPLVKRFRRVHGHVVTHGILASNSIITVKYSVSAATTEEASQLLGGITKEFRKILKPFIFGEDDESLPSVIGKILQKKQETLSVAESCTGGLIAKLLTDVPGSSHFLLEGLVTYSNTSKRKRLGVSPASLNKWGAVSSQVAKEMARGARTKSNSDYSISVTGIAGPDGGTRKKPVGLVFIGCSSARGTRVKKFQFSGDRDWIRHRAAMMALELLRKELK